MKNKENESVGHLFYLQKCMLLKMKRCFVCYVWIYEGQSAAAAAKSLQSCPTLCKPIDGSSPGSPVPGILQARTLEWLAISFSNAWKGKVKVKSLSCARLFSTPWSAAYQAPPSMGFSRQEYWSGVPLPSPSINLRFPRSAGPSKTDSEAGIPWSSLTQLSTKAHIKRFPGWDLDLRHPASRTVGKFISVVPTI